MRKYYFSWPNVSINIEQTLPQHKVLTVLYTFLMIMNLNETNHHGALVVLGKINKIVSCCLFDTHTNYSCQQGSHFKDELILNIPV